MLGDGDAICCAPMVGAQQLIGTASTPRPYQPGPHTCDGLLRRQMVIATAALPQQDAARGLGPERQWPVVVRNVGVAACRAAMLRIA
jgi:hypothetical protein